MSYSLQRHCKWIVHEDLSWDFSWLACKTAYLKIKDLFHIEWLSNDVFNFVSMHCLKSISRLKVTLYFDSP